MLNSPELYLNSPFEEFARFIIDYNLKAVSSVRYSRQSYLDNDHHVKVTIDQNINYFPINESNPFTSTTSLDPVKKDAHMIVEVKFIDGSPPPRSLDQIKELGIPSHASKFRRSIESLRARKRMAIGVKV